ncbi:MAG: prolipoprotein diacylglyceryl transferase [Chthoniobacterales bacterium]|nr:prolipoprotein diacylglyceryl transferase [Chthoniobacterales bacterium]
MVEQVTDSGVSGGSYFLHDISPFIIQFTEGFGIRWYGVAYLAAFLIAWWMVVGFARRKLAEIPPEQVSDFLFVWIIPGTLIGGRLGHFVFYDFGALLEDPFAFFRVWEGGMSAHGGILGIVVASWLYSRHAKLSWLNLGDNLVVPAPIGLFLGRVANFINGELYGRRAEVPWAVQFPRELEVNSELALQVIRQLPVEIREQGLGVILAKHPYPIEVRRVLLEVLPPRHPSQLYEAALEGGVLFFILYFLHTRCRLPRGAVTGVFFVGYAILRSVGEFFREPEVPSVGPFTYGQFLSLFLLFIGVAFLVASKRQKKEVC